MLKLGSLILVLYTGLLILWDHNKLKEYSVILTTSFYGMNQKIHCVTKKKKKKLIPKVSVDTNFTLSSYA